jgi:hypothetical protein
MQASDGYKLSQKAVRRLKKTSLELTVDAALPKEEEKVINSTYNVLALFQ